MADRRGLLLRRAPRTPSPAKPAGLRPRRVDGDRARRAGRCAVRRPRKRDRVLLASPDRCTRARDHRGRSRACERQTRCGPGRERENGASHRRHARPQGLAKRHDGVHDRRGGIPRHAPRRVAVRHSWSGARRSLLRRGSSSERLWTIHDELVERAVRGTAGNPPNEGANHHRGGYRL